AEGIDQLQFRYLLHSGVWVSDPTGNEANVRAVEVFLLARTHGPVKGYWDDNTYAMDNGPYNNNPPNDPYRRKLLSSIIRTRNIGL
ncbi:MAG: hypothetical protein GY849_24465, partial [Deltaproteobacteria bacterium]|nr:hypothetical protein [Deltaproteobacteria bacterium]